MSLKQSILNSWFGVTLCKCYGFYVHFLMWCFGRVRKQPPENDTTPRDLLIYHQDLLGDLLIWLPTIDALARYTHQRDGKVVLIVQNSSYAEFIQRMNIVDCVLAGSAFTPHGHLIWRLLRARKNIRSALQEYHFRESVVTSFLRLHIEDFVMDAVKAPLRFCFSTLYRRIQEFSPRISPYNRLYQFDTAQSVQQNVLNFYQYITGEPPQLPARYYALVPGASTPLRRWPTENFATIAKRLLDDDPECDIVILGSPNEECLAQQIIAKINAPQRMYNLAGKTSLAQLAAVLSHANTVISNDTGTAHFAMLLGRPTIVILGGGHYGLFGPNPLCKHGHWITCANHTCFKCNWQCHFPINQNAPFPCIANITPDQVWQEFNNEKTE